MVDSSGTRSESRDRIESQPDQLQQQLQPRFGMPPVHSTPTANANSTIDREIQNLDRHLERLSRDRDEAVIFEDTAKEREFKRLQEQSKLDTEPPFSRQQGAYDQSEDIKESVDHRTATSKRRVSFGPMTDIHVSDDQGVRPKIMSNLSRLKKDGEECLAANRGILGDASEKQVQSRSGLKLREEKKESVDYRLPRLDEEFNRDQRPTVKQMSMEFADNGTAEKQCKLPDGRLDRYAPKSENPNTGLTKYNEDSNKGIHYYAQGADGYDEDDDSYQDQMLSGHEQRAAHFEMENDRIKSEPQTDRESELLQREEQLRKREIEVEHTETSRKMRAETDI